jgi:hypothetical protein
MRSMRSMRWDLFAVIGGPCKRSPDAVRLTRMPVVIAEACARFSVIV